MHLLFECYFENSDPNYLRKFTVLRFLCIIIMTTQNLGIKSQLFYSFLNLTLKYVF